AKAVLRFEVRACPVVRSASATRYHRKGAEIDAFLAACGRADGDDVERGSVYEQWLVEQFRRRGDVTLTSVRMRRFELATFYRRTHDDRNTARTFRRPAV